MTEEIRHYEANKSVPGNPVYPDPQATLDNHKKLPLNPNAAFELKAMDMRNSGTVASRNPEIRKFALIFIGLVAFLMLYQLFMISVEKSAGELKAGLVDELIKRVGLWSLVLMIIQLCGAVVLLFTRSLAAAKTIILAAGLSFLYFTAMELINLSPVGIVVGIFILWRIYEAYESL